VSLHTPQSIWEKYKQPMLEIGSDGIGVCLDENTCLYTRWSAELRCEQVTKWLAFFAKLVADPAMLDELAGIAPAGESCQVISLSELRAGLALLTRSRAD
jgi:hypothetical protein